MSEFGFDDLRVRVRSSEFEFGVRVRIRSQSSGSGSGSVLSSVIFNPFVKDNDSKLKQSVSRLVIKALHTAKKMNQELKD